MSDFSNSLKKYVDYFEDNLPKFLPEAKPYQEVLSDSVIYCITDGGKRIRPVLVLEFCRICCGEYEKAMPFAAAIEMIHSYSLAHDDLPCMDDDDMRRGKPSCHKKFGEANALLAGDALLTLAFDTIANRTDFNTVSPLQAIRAAGVLAEKAGVYGMIGGQVIDLQSEGKKADIEILKLMDSKKTSALISAACQMGCIIGGADDHKVKLAGDFAEKIGLAFQIVDDILDVKGDAKLLGKPVGSDSENDKSTYVSLLGLDESQQIVDKLTDEAIEILNEFDGSDFLKELTLFLAKRDY